MNTDNKVNRRNVNILGIHIVCQSLNITLVSINVVNNNNKYNKLPDNVVGFANTHKDMLFGYRGATYVIPRTEFQTMDVVAQFRRWIKMVEERKNGLFTCVICLEQVEGVNNCICCTAGICFDCTNRLVYWNTYNGIGFDCPSCRIFVPGDVRVVN
jgi:hypothetical protein